MNELLTNKTCIIDADSLIYQHGWIHRESNNFDDHLKSINSHINEIIYHSGCNSYLVFLTENRNTFRTKWATQREYKGQRPKEKIKFFHDLKNHLYNYWNAFSIPELEADDLCLIARTKYGEDNCVIASIDKDLRQISGQFYNYKKMEMMTITTDEAYKNLWIQVLMGDSSDNVPGCEGIGIKTAEKILANVPFSEYPHIILDTYIEKYGVSEGLDRMNETFHLVYLLRDWHKEEFKLPEHTTIILDTPISSNESTEVEFN